MSVNIQETCFYYATTTFTNYTKIKDYDLKKFPFHFRNNLYLQFKWRFYKTYRTSLITEPTHTEEIIMGITRWFSQILIIHYNIIKGCLRLQLGNPKYPGIQRSQSRPVNPSLHRHPSNSLGTHSPSTAPLTSHSHSKNVVKFQPNG